MHLVKTLYDFGGKPDPECTDNSAAFAAAFDFFKKENGGTLQLSAGMWYTGPVKLCSGMKLEILPDAVLSFIPAPTRYTPVHTRWEGIVCWAMHPCLLADAAENVEISGGGTIDGNGSAWWNLLPEKLKQGKPVSVFEQKLASLNPGYENQPGGGGGRNTQFLRPPLVQFLNCKKVLIRNVTLTNSPFWTLHPLFSSDIQIISVHIKNPENAPNTDGIDIDSCESVIVKDCFISVGDDGIAVKSGSGEDGIRMNRPSQNVHISGCTVSNGHGGVVLGSETAAGIENITVEQCRFIGTDRGIRIKTRRGRGGVVQHLLFDSLVMEHNLCPIAINMFYCCGTNRTEQELFSTEMMPVKEDTPVIKDVIIRNVRAAGCKASAGFIAALPESPLLHLTIENSVFETDENAAEKPDLSDMFAGLPAVEAKSFRVINSQDTVFDNVQIFGPEHPFLFE